MNGNIAGIPGLILAEMTPEKAGQMTGSAIVWMALLGGIFRCWQVSRQPATNKKCVLSLMFLLMAVLLPCCAMTATKLFGTGLLAGAISAIMGLAMMAAFFTAVVLAILGLVEFSQNPGAHTRGYTPAIWTLALCVVLIGVGVIGAIVGVSRGTMMAVRVDPGQSSKFEDDNFEFTAPGSPWTAMNAAKISKQARLAFLRQYPETYFMVASEKVGARMELSTEHYADMGREHMRAMAGDSVKVLSETPLEINGLAGLLDETEAEVASLRIYYKQWYVVTNGYAYELMAWGSVENRGSIDDESRQMFFRFKQIDPHRIAGAAGKRFSSDFFSTRYNYRVDVANSAWNQSAMLEKNFPRAEFSASQGDSCFAVVPVWLGGQKIDLEALTAGLLAIWNVEYPNENLTHRKQIQENGGSGVVCDFTRDLDGTPFKYRFKILQRAGNAYLVAAWTQRKTDIETTLSDAVARVRFDVNPTPPSGLTQEYSEQEHKTQGFVLNQAGLFHQKAGDHELALPLFCAAARANSQEPIFVQNALLSWRYLDRPKEALAFLDHLSLSNSLTLSARADQAWFQAQADLADQAITNYADVFASGYHNDNDFTTYVELLNQQRKYDRALTEVHNYLQIEDSVAVRLLEASIYRQKKEFPKAISLLKTQRDSDPDNSQIANALAETFNQAGQYTEALKISRALLEQNGDSSYVYFLKGRSELGLKWYREAKQSFAAAARLAPASREIQSYVDYTSGLLGEGDNSLVREAIEPVLFPASLTNSLAGPVPIGYATNYGAYYARQIVAIAYTSGKEHKTTEYTIARVLDAYGVSAFSTVQIAFDPQDEEIFVNDIRVLDPDGKTISVGNVDNYYVLDDHAGQEASRKKILNIPVAGLQPGDQLELTVTRRTLGPLDEFPFFEHFFAATFPTRESILFFAGDANGLKYRTSPPMEPAKLPEGLCWRVTAPMTARWEPLQPPAASFLPVLWIGDASAQWPEVASNYLASISDRLKGSPPLLDLVNRLVGSATNDEQRIAALSRYVQTNYTYKAIEFGRRSRVPNSPADIINNKYGDCKDHSVLLQQMLESAGVPARLALVNTRDLIQPDMPSLDQFDHMIVYVTNSMGAKFLDCTAKGADVAQAIPYGQAGRAALILDPQQPRFVTLPAYPENASGIEVQQHLHLVDHTDLAVEETLSLTGIAAAGMREYLLMIPEATLKTTLQSQFEMSDVQLDGVQVESLNAPDQPLRLKFQYTIKKQFHTLDGRLTGALRTGFARWYLAPAPSEDRQTPFETIIPRSFRMSITLDAPAGFHAETPDPLDVKLDPRFASVQTTTQTKGNGLQLEFECREKTGSFPASDYVAYQDTMNKALSSLERAVAFAAGER